MLDHLLGSIPWTSATVHAALLGVASTWAAYLTHADVGGQPVTLKVALLATWAGLMAVYQRRATESLAPVPAKPADSPEVVAAKAVLAKADPALAAKLGIG